MPFGNSHCCSQFAMRVRKIEECDQDHTVKFLDSNAGVFEVTNYRKFL